MVLTILGCNDSNPFRKDQLCKALEEVQLLFTLTQASMSSLDLHERVSHVHVHVFFFFFCLTPPLALESCDTVKSYLREYYLPRMLKDNNLQLGMLISLERSRSTEKPTKELYDDVQEQCENSVVSTERRDRVDGDEVKTGARREEKRTSH